MTKAPGTKKKTAASIQRLMEEVPLCPAAAIQRGPRTVAILNSSTSQKPMVLRNCDLGSSEAGAEIVIESPGVAERSHNALENHNGLSTSSPCARLVNDRRRFHFEERRGSRPVTSPRRPTPH